MRKRISTDATAAYGAHTLRYHEATNQWTAIIDSDTVAADSMEKLKRKIDRITKPKAAERVSAYMFDRWSDEGVKKVVVTSTSEDRYGWNAWVTYDGKREKVSPNALFKDTPAVVKLLAARKLLVDEERVLTAKKKKNMDALYEHHIDVKEDEEAKQ